MAFCDYGILQNTSGIWDWLAESLNISEWSKKDYAGLQELFWCLAKMRCHSISCTSALLSSSAQPHLSYQQHSQGVPKQTGNFKHSLPVPSRQVYL